MIEGVPASTWLGWLVAAATAAGSWWLARQAKAAGDRETLVVKVTRLETKMDIFTDELRELRQENRDLGERGMVIGREAAAGAKAAYHEANTVNNKLAVLGVQLVEKTDGR